MTEPSTEPAAPTPARSWVWRSTPDSVEAGTFSVLACVETVVAVGIYFYTALQLADLPYWWTSILVAPLLLMRSEQSFALGVVWMKSYWEEFNSQDAPDDLGVIVRQRTFWLVLVLSCALSFAASYALSKYWLVGHEGFAVFWRGMVVGAGAVAVFFVPGVALGIWLRTLAIRFAATVTHPLAGMQSLPSNWWRTLFATDCRHPPELVPGRPASDLTLGHWYRQLRDAKVDWFIRLFALFVMVCFVPAYFYRLSIKSTCWFYLPLFYVLRRAKREVADDPAEQRDRVLGHPLNWIMLALACVTVIGCIATAASKTELASVTAMLGAGRVSVLEVLVVLNWDAVKPWQYLAMASAACTLLVWHLAFVLRIDIRYAAKADVENEAKRHARWIQFLERCAHVFTTYWVLVLLAHIAISGPIGPLLPMKSCVALHRFFEGPVWAPWILREGTPIVAACLPWLPPL